MIVPSIDLMGGRTVQLVGGREKVLDAGDPLPLARGFGVVGEVAVIDLDAALGRGSNKDLVQGLLGAAPCRVGGGIRDVATALDWLDRGAAKVLLGTAAVPEVLSRLPRDRVIAAIDGLDGEVVVDGWRTRTGDAVSDRLRALRGLAGGFLVTFVEGEGRMQGIDLDRVRALREAAGEARLTVAGGLRDAAEVAALDAIGVDAQVGMGLYTGRFDLAAALAAMLRSERSDGLWPTLVADETGTALGLAWSSEDSLREALGRGRGVYHSRRRGLWEKGGTSGSRQELRHVELDCDRDTLRFTVRQHGSGFCHRGRWTCFGEERGLGALERRLAARAATPAAGSYTRRLLDDPELLRAKLVEEAAELAAARGADAVASEAADVLYFTMTALRRAGVRLGSVLAELDRRALRVTRRPGNAKPEGSR